MMMMNDMDDTVTTNETVHEARITGGQGLVPIVGRLWRVTDEWGDMVGSAPRGARRWGKLVWVAKDWWK